MKRLNMHIIKRLCQEIHRYPADAQLKILVILLIRQFFGFINEGAWNISPVHLTGLEGPESFRLNSDVIEQKC